MKGMAHTLAYDGAIMGDTQSGKPLPAGRWSSAKAATIVMDGGASPEWLRAAAWALVEVLPQAEHLTVEGVDHSAAAIAPQTLVPHLVEFFAD